MVQVKAIHRPPINDCGIVKTRKCSNRACPFFDWVVQKWLAAELCQLVRHLLRRCRSFQDDTHFVREMLRVGLKTTHHSVDTVGVKDETVQTFVCRATQHASNAFVNIAAH